MATREQNIAAIRNAIYGKDVREAIADGLEQTYAECEAMLAYGFTDDAKEALLALCEKLAYTVENGQDYVDALEEALQYKTWMITNALTNCATSNLATSVMKGGAYSATITPSAGYTLDGATVSITMGGNDITATAYSNGVISIPAVTGALVITVSAAQAAVSSISAVFTQGDNVIYDTDSLDTLKQYLEVTATFDDESAAVIPASSYTLSGTLAEGTSTITVSFGGKTDTFTVTVSIGLDSIAYGTTTYREMFITNNLAFIGDFEGDITLASTVQDYEGDSTKTYRINAGSPSVSTDYANSPTHSLKCFGTVSAQILIQNDAIISAGLYMVGFAAKCSRYSAGKLGVQFGLPVPTAVEKATVAIESTTSGFQTVTDLFTVADTRNGIYAYIGSMSSANLDGYIDDVVIVPLPSGTTLEQATTLYNKYLGIRRAS